MYYPYFRGKQFELLSIRESASLIAGAGFVPIIEPVREALSGLEKALDALESSGARAIVIINPRYGDHSTDGEKILELIKARPAGRSAISPGILLTGRTSVSDVQARLDSVEPENAVLVHSGFTEARELASAISESESSVISVFSEDDTSMLYRRHFKDGEKILLRDGFNPQKNASYPPLERFSDLHATFGEWGMDGYGDFLTVGDTYSEGGGPAYAVAIHLTFIDKEQDDEMFVYHFKSVTNDTPTDPAGKFAQALEKLMQALESGNSSLLETSAIKEFRTLYERGHFPGLGYVKKLSIKHHLETLANYHRVG